MTQTFVHTPAMTSVLLPDSRTVLANRAFSSEFGVEIANLVEQHGVRVRAVGHDGQHDAIKLPGLFSEMLREERHLQVTFDRPLLHAEGRARGIGPDDGSSLPVRSASPTEVPPNFITTVPDTRGSLGKP